MFYCVNRVQKSMIADNKEESIDFYNYPWSNSDKIIKNNITMIHYVKTPDKPFIERLVSLSKK